MNRKDRYKTHEEFLEHFLDKNYDLGGLYIGDDKLHLKSPLDHKLTPFLIYVEDEVYNFLIHNVIWLDGRTQSVDASKCNDKFVIVVNEKDDYPAICYACAIAWLKYSKFTGDLEVEARNLAKTWSKRAKVNA